MLLKGTFYYGKSDFLAGADTANEAGIAGPDPEIRSDLLPPPMLHSRVWMSQGLRKSPSFHRGNGWGHLAIHPRAQDMDGERPEVTE